MGRPSWEQRRRTGQRAGVGPWWRRTSRPPVASARPPTVRPPISAASQSNEVVPLSPSRMMAGVTELRASTASGTVRPSGRPVVYHRLRRRARREAVTTIVGSRWGCRALNVGAVRQVTAVGSPGRAVRCRADACADESDDHAGNERNAEHVELLLFGPLGAAGQDTVVCSRRSEGNAGCKTAATTAQSPANRRKTRADRDSVGWMAVVRFRVLGSLEVEVDGALVELGGARQRAVLAVLLMHANEPVGTDRLVSESWGETAPATATKTAQVYVSRLRRALGNDTLTTTPAGYLLHVPQGALDTDELDELRARAREADPREAGQSAASGPRPLARPAVCRPALRGRAANRRSDASKSCA